MSLHALNWCAAMLLLAGCNANGQAPDQPANGVRADLYACDGCEAPAERDASTLDWSADIRGEEPGDTLVLTGQVLSADDKQPAANVVIYLHQTDSEGLYVGGAAGSVASDRHGRLKGWVRTDDEGRYRFITIKPAPYPTMTMPAHIHLYVLEPGKRPYYVDDVVFEGEFGVDEDYRAAQELRGGGGIVSLARDDEGRWLANRDIVLERHPD